MNGWKNHATWNVALWIENDEGLYDLAKEYKRATGPFLAFTAALKELMEGAPISFETPDNVAWNDSSLDVDELDIMIKEL